MRKYQVTYQMLSEFVVVVAAEDEDAAKDIVAESPSPTSYLVDGEGFEVEPDFIQSDIYYDTIDAMEVEA